MFLGELQSCWPMSVPLNGARRAVPLNRRSVKLHYWCLGHLLEGFSLYIYIYVCVCSFSPSHSFPGWGVSALCRRSGCSEWLFAAEDNGKTRKVQRRCGIHSSLAHALYLRSYCVQSGHHDNRESESLLSVCAAARRWHLHWASLSPASRPFN